MNDGSPRQSVSRPEPAPLTGRNRPAMIVEREHLERLTKPQLVDATILAEQRARDAAPPRPVVVHEADALAGCIRALDLLNEAERRGNSANIGMSGYVS